MSGSASDATDGERWLVVTVAAPPRGEEHLLVDALRRTGARAVEREGERFAALLPPPASLGALLRDVEVAVRASTSLRGPAPAWRWTTADEWSARWSRDAAPRRVTGRITVAALDADGGEGGVGAVLIRLRPGLAFGTAQHPTTRGCLRLLESLVRPGDRVADVGAGSAILAIAAARLGAGGVVALEADAVACAAARANVAENGVADRVEVVHAEVGAGDLAAPGPFGGIVANIEYAVIAPLLTEMHGALAPGGWLVLSGVLPQERAAIAAAAARAGLEPRAESAESGWWAGSFVRAADAAQRGSRPPG